jgi:chemotaxis protein CheY-P-specific phosphatase CheC
MIPYDMDANMKNLEEDIAKEIIQIGLSKAADALSFFVKDRVLVRPVDLNIGGDPALLAPEPTTGARMFLLGTELKGAIAGSAYLLFNEEDVAFMRDTQPLGAIGDEPLMLEVANILTAMVVTQFANILDQVMYGYVPYLEVLPDHNVAHRLKAAVPPGHDAVQFTATFYTDRIRLQPKFVWYMDAHFFHAVAQLMSDKDKVELVRNMTKAA